MVLLLFTVDYIACSLSFPQRDQDFRTKISRHELPIFVLAKATMKLVYWPNTNYTSETRRLKNLFYDTNATWIYLKVNFISLEINIGYGLLNVQIYHM